MMTSTRCSHVAICAQIPWTEIAPGLVKKLGSGSFGQVYEAYWRSALVAVKIVNLEEADMSCNLNCALARFK